MCSTPKAADPIPPAPPAPPAPPPPVLATNPLEEQAKGGATAAKGRASLRIDRTTTLGGQGGGLNIPK